METVTQRRVSANEVRKPITTAPASVFDIASKAKAEKPPRLEFDVAGLTIRKGVPMPEATRGIQGSKYKALLDKMNVGDSVVLPTKTAHSMIAAAKKLKVKAALRSLGNGTAGVWKL